MKTWLNARIRDQKGTSLIETLVVISLFSILGLTLAFTDIHMMSNRSWLRNNSIASQLAIEGLEQFAGIDPATLSSADTTVGNITRENVEFTRAIVISTNADGSRSIEVTVYCAQCSVGGTATASGNFPLWGSV